MTLDEYEAIFDIDEAVPVEKMEPSLALLESAEEYLGMTMDWRIAGPVQIEMVQVDADPGTVVELWGKDPRIPLIRMGPGEWVPRWDESSILVDDRHFV